MRVILLAFCTAGFLATVAFATPLSRQKRGVGAFSFAGLPFAGGFAGAGTGYGGFGFPVFGPFFGDRGFAPYPFVPMPVIPRFNFPKNWYEGDNVCKEEKIKVLEDSKDDWFSEVSDVNMDSTHEQEMCKGDNKKYVCQKRVYSSDGQMQTKLTKYECCYGFVRNPNGPGCVESSNASGSPQGTNGNLKQNDASFYQIVPLDVRSSSSSSSSSIRGSRTPSPGNVDKVPIQ